MAIKLGQRVKDLVTGFEGIAASIHTYMHGCRRIAIEPKALDDKGKPISPQLFDEHRVEIVEDLPIPFATHMIGANMSPQEAINAAPPGGDRDDDALVTRSSRE